MTESPALDALLAGEETLDPYAERILDAARDQLTEHGLRRTSLDDIARAAGVGRATLFRRFPGRDALLGALIARESQRLIATVDAEVARVEDPAERAVVGFIAFTKALANEKLGQRLLVTDPDQVLPLLTVEGGPILALGRAYLAGQVRRAKADGLEIPGEPEQVAELLARLALSLALTPDTVLPLDDAAELERFVRATLVPMVTGGTAE